MNSSYLRLSVLGAIFCCVVGCAAHPRAGSSGQVVMPEVDSGQTTGIESSDMPLASPLNPSESSTNIAPTSEAQSEVGSSTVPIDPSATEITPTSSVSSSAAESVPWPPIIIFGDILEAGTSEVEFGGLRIQVPAGFIKTDGSAEMLNYEAVRPDTGGSGSVRLRLSPDANTDVIEQLSMLAVPTPSQVGPISVPGAVSAAIGLSVVDDRKTWTLGVNTVQGLVTISFGAPSSDFDWFLLPQSLASVRIHP